MLSAPLVAGASFAYLMLLFGVAPATAIGTDLWFAALTKIVGGFMHHSKGSVDWQVLRRL